MEIKLNRTEIRKLGGFKPGYPVAHGTGMVLDRDLATVSENCRKAGVKMEREFCGHDYNYGGALYRFARQA